MEFRSLEKKDYDLVIDLAAAGMSYGVFTDDPKARRATCKHDFYESLMRATGTMAAYEDDKLAGVMILAFKGENKVNVSFLKKIYVVITTIIQNLSRSKEEDSYEEVTKELLKMYSKDNEYDGELVYFVSNPHLGIKGTGTKLLNELERKYQGKKLFLYTDAGCTYQFYEHRGFKRCVERPMRYKFDGEIKSIQCFLYSKTLGGLK